VTDRSEANTMVFASPPSGHHGYPAPKVPPLPRSSANDPFDTGSNLNPGGGGGGTKPSNKPSLR